MAICKGKGFLEVAVGEQFGDALTITEAHLIQAAGLTGDFNPLHLDEEFAKKSRFGRRILHGPITNAIMTAPAGMLFAGTAIAYLEQSCRFKSPVFIGDTLRTQWTITALAPKPKLGGGIISMQAECRNQRGEIVAQGEGKILVADRHPE